MYTLRTIHVLALAQSNDDNHLKYTLLQKKLKFNLSIFPGAPGSLTLT